MTECVHEWGIIYNVMEELLQVRCMGDEDCDAELEIDQAETRLNEYETLRREVVSAKDYITQYLDEAHPSHTEDITVLAFADGHLRDALSQEGK